MGHETLKRNNGQLRRPVTTSEFDSYAAAYQDLLHDPVRDRFASTPEYFHRRKAEVIQRFFAQRDITTNAMSWLDVGCGRGELLKMAGAGFARSIGCDPSARMTEACAGIETFDQASPTELPFPDKSFDFITAVCVYHHVEPRKRATLTESIRRVLKPDGVFCLMEHNPLNPITQLVVRRCPIDVNAELLTSISAKQLMRSAGFVTVDTSYFLYLPESVSSRIGSVENALNRLPFGGQYAIFARKPGE